MIEISLITIGIFAFSLVLSILLSKSKDFEQTIEDLTEVDKLNH